MKPIVIIKAGSTFPWIAAKHGDFEAWIIKGSGLTPDRFRVISIQGRRFPPLPQVGGIVITGSHEMITETSARNRAFETWLRQAVDQRIPTLGICYGHHLLAQVAGGTVGYLKGGAEMGTVRIRLLPEAGTDRLLGSLPPDFVAQSAHSQTVLTLPPGAVLLASGDRDPHQAFGLHGSAWGVQFHPEFSAEILRLYLRQEQLMLENQGVDPVALARAARETPCGEQLLHRFVELINE